jgi:hypothetical protein
MNDCADIKAWFRKVKETGILSGHDIDEAGVNRAVKEMFGDKFNTRGRWLVRKEEEHHCYNTG